MNKTPLQDKDYATTTRSVHLRPGAAATAVTPGTLSDNEVLVSCHCDSAKSIWTLLSCLQEATTRNKSTATASSKQQQQSSSLMPVTVFCSPTNLTFHHHHSNKQIQASVDFSSTMFSEYHVAPSLPYHQHDDEHDDTWRAGGQFGIHLTTLLECLQLLEDRTKLYFSYNTAVEIFKLELLLQDGVLCSAAIPGIMVNDDDEDSNTSLATAFRSSPVMARLIVKAQALSDLITELELVPGATCGTVSLNRTALEIAVVGDLGECLVSLPATGSHVISLEVVGTSNTAASFTYPLHSLLASLKPCCLDIAYETCITINAAGMMAIQHQIIDPMAAGNNNNNPNFVDFIMCCLEEQVDADGEQENKLTVARPRDVAAESSYQSSPQSRISLAYSQSIREKHEPGQRLRSRARPILYSSSATTTPRDHSRNSDSETEDESFAKAQSAAPLFGVLPSASSPDVGCAAPTQAIRRRQFGNHRGGSKRIKASKPSSNAETSAEEEDDDTQLLEIAASSPQSAPSRRLVESDSRCSSPEIVYGRQS